MTLHHCQGDGAIGTRARLQIDTQLGDRGAARVNGDELRPLLNPLTDLPSYRPVTFVRIASPEDDAVGIHRLFDGIATEGNLARQDTGTETDAFRD